MKDTDYDLVHTDPETPGGRYLRLFWQPVYRGLDLPVEHAIPIRIMGEDYHGWKYDSSGQCIEQPGEDESFAAKVRIRSYPTEEYFGLIFVYFGDGEAPPLRRFPDFEKLGVLETDPPETWPCNFMNRLGSV